MSFGNLNIRKQKVHLLQEISMNQSNTQTNKESRSRKFSFPRNSSFTNESISEATDCHLPQHLMTYSQIDGRSNGNDEMMLFEGQPSQIQPESSNQAPGSHYLPADSRLRWRFDTDKMIQYEEMLSKGSERPASMFAPGTAQAMGTAINGGMGGNGGGGGPTSNSIMISGTPTDASNYNYNNRHQTFYQINYINGAQNGQNQGTRAPSGGVFDPYSVGKLHNLRNRGSSNSRYQPTQFLNNGGLSSLSHNGGQHNYPNSAGGFYPENTLSSALMPHSLNNGLSKKSLLNLVQDLDFGQYLNHSEYLQGQALISPRHLKQAVMKYDKQFNTRDLRWSEFSILQKFLYLFENQKNFDKDQMLYPLRQTNKRPLMNIQQQQEFPHQHPHPVAHSSLNHHRASRLNSNELQQHHGNTLDSSNFKPNSSGFKKDQQQQILQVDGISEIKHFIENFRSDDHLEAHSKALDVLIEDQRIQLLQRSHRIEFLEKKIELLEEQSTKMKDRLHQNIEQYEHEIKIKEEIHTREKDNLMNQIKQQNEEVERIKKEQQTKEKQLQETISMLETQLRRLGVSINESFQKSTQISPNRQKITSGFKGSAAEFGNTATSNGFRSIRKSDTNERTMSGTKNPFDDQSDQHYYEPQIIPSGAPQPTDFHFYQPGAVNMQEYDEPQINMRGSQQAFALDPHQRNQSANPSEGNGQKKGKSVRLSIENNLQKQPIAKSADRAAAGGNLVLRSDQIRRIYNNQVNSNKQNFISPASVGGIANARKNNPSANSAYNKAINNSAVTENSGAGQMMFDQTQIYSQYSTGQNLMPANYLNEKQKMMNQINMHNELQSYQTTVEQYAAQGQPHPANRAVSQNYQSSVSINRGTNDLMPNSGRSKTPNDTAHFNKSARQTGDLVRHLRMVSMNNQHQKRVFNGSVDFNQTDSNPLATRYLRDIKSYNRFAGSVSPSHHQNVMIEGFSERAFDNLNQTVTLTLGNSNKLLNNGSNSNIGSRQQIKRNMMAAEAMKKRDIIARSSIESIHSNMLMQHGSPLPLDNPNQQRAIMPSQLEKNLNQQLDRIQVKNLKINRGGVPASSSTEMQMIQQHVVQPQPQGRGQKLKIKVAKDYVQRKQQQNDDNNRMSQVTVNDIQGNNESQIMVSLPQSNFSTINQAVEIPKRVKGGIVNSSIQIPRNELIRHQQQIDASANVSVLSAGENKVAHIIDSSRIKIKASANNIITNQQPLNKNLKISPYQINWNSSNQQQMQLGSKPQSTLKQQVLRQSHQIPVSSRQPASLPMQQDFNQQQYIEATNPQLTQSPVIPGGKGIHGIKMMSRAAAGKALMSDRQAAQANAKVSMGNYLQNGIEMQQDPCKVNNWIVTDF